ncbi:hypothetical protein SH528x_003395 [Novipirellula sp. SH528]|uniref:hypothetical protein n=1 Tax=Novipirellula sp. SH528 TaxID=3454466 RepID=UPI003FA0696A
MTRHKRAIRWMLWFAAILAVLTCISYLPGFRLRLAGAHHRHLKSGEWVIVEASTNMSDQGFARLVAEIERNGAYDVLSVSGAKVTDAGFAPVKKLNMLNWIQISDCSLSDTALQHLYGLPDLHTIKIVDCPNISPEGVADLQAALPDCSITYKNGG